MRRDFAVQRIRRCTAFARALFSIFIEKVSMQACLNRLALTLFSSYEKRWQCRVFFLVKNHLASQKSVILEIFLSPNDCFGQPCIAIFFGKNHRFLRCKGISITRLRGLWWDSEELCASSFSHF